MRKLAASLSMVLVASVASAQSSDAATALGWATTFLASARTIDAPFQQDAWVQVYARTTTSHGRLRIARPEQVRLDYGSGDVAVANGADYLFVQPADGTWPAQYTHGRSDVVSAALSVLVSGGAIARDYVSSACAGGRAPSGTVCIELQPRAEHPPFERIRLYVRSDVERRGEPARLAIAMNDGNWDTFTFESLHVNDAIDASLFSMTPPAGAHPTPASR